ncbi:MAG: PKD domain-containing protein [Saprospiraceae bacterium]|nr:PKD domain-containing protein [Saprospiraceae bacterium]
MKSFKYLIVRQLCSIIVIFLSFLPGYAQNCAELDFKYELIDNIVVFSGECDKVVSEWHWYTGDNQTDSGQIIKHKYQKSGEYEVCLKVLVSQDCSAFVCKKIIVTADTQDCGLESDFEYKTDGNNVYLNARSNDDKATYYWYVNGLSPSYTGKEIKLPFEKEGYYEVCLVTVDGAETCKVRTCKKIEIKPCELKTDFSYVNTGNTVRFSAQSSDNAASYYWYSKDIAVNLSGSDISISFDKSGVYEVCLVAVNSPQSCKIQVCKNISAGDKVSVYPNPATEIIRIASEYKFDYAFIYDLQNVLLLSLPVENEAIDISTLNTGMYLLNLQKKGGGIESLRFYKN